MEVLRDMDREVDFILQSLILAKLDLERILCSVNEYDVKSENIAQLLKWTQDHQSVMDFSIFNEIKNYFPEPFEEETILRKEHIKQLLEHCEGMECLGYADEKLGIQREYIHVDGQNCGGWGYKRTNGRYEDVNIRFKRDLRKLTRTNF